MAARKGQDPVTCAGCGREFEVHAVGSRGRCVYCGGELRGAVPPQLELVPESEPTEEEVPPAERARRGKARARGVKVLRGTGPSRWVQPTSWIQESTALVSLLVLAAAALGLALRDHPALPPRALPVGVLIAVPLALAGGRLLAWSLDLLGSGARSVLLAVPLLVLGLLFGIPGAVARLLVRALPRAAGVWGLLAALAIAGVTLAWLARHRDPWRHARDVAAAGSDDPRWRPDFVLAPTGWAGSAPEVEDGAFALRLERVAGDEAWGTLTWVDHRRADVVHAAWSANHLALAYPGPPGHGAAWRWIGAGSTLDLWIDADGRIEGRDRLFGTRIEAARAWAGGGAEPERAASPGGPSRATPDTAPVLQSPAVLRPLIAVDEEEVSTGRAFVLRPTAGAEPLVLTAASLFGPTGGLTRPVIPAMLPALAGEAHFFDLPSGAMRARGRVGAPVRGARPLAASDDGPPDASGDLVAFALLPGSSAPPLALRADPVAQGLALWLPLRPDEAEAEERLLAGRVSAVWEHGFSVRLEALPPPGELVGAPLLDSRGEVAGMLVGTEGAAERALGIALPATWIAARLEGWAP